MTYLSAELANWKVLRERLKARFPDLDDADLVDSLDGETSVKEAVVSLLNKMADDEMMVAGIEAREKQLADRRQRLAARVERIRLAAFTALDETGLRIEEPEFTAYVQPTARKVVITDEGEIPDEYVETKRTPKKAEIAAALKDKKDVPGATLSNAGRTLIVRRA